MERDPVGEAKDRIAELEKTINGLQTKLHDAGKQEHGKISGLEKELAQKSKQLAELQQEIAQSRQDRDVKKLKKGLLDEEKKKSEAFKWFEKAYNSKSPQQKIELYSKAIELDPKDVLAYNNRGYAYSKLQEYDRATADYDKAIELVPKYATAYYNRGSAYGKLQNYDRAIADYDKAIELDPKDATAYSNRGIAYDELQDYDRAIADYDKAIELDPKYATAYSNRGSAYRKLQEYDRAIADYDNAIELDPKDATAYENLTELRIIMNDFKAAFGTISGKFKEFEDRNDQIIALYLELVCRRLLGKKRTALESKLKQFLQGGSASSWSFIQFEQWLAKAPLDEDVKNYIHEKTELLKQHQTQP